MEKEKTHVQKSFPSVLLFLVFDELGVDLLAVVFEEWCYFFKAF